MIKKIYVFPQIWSSTALGFDVNGSCGGQGITEVYTTVVKMVLCKVESGKSVNGMVRIGSEENIYAVFFDGRIAYMCLNPSYELLLDISNMNMKSQREAIKYYEDDKYFKNSRVSIL